jgi:hypothetical protein
VISFTICYDAPTFVKEAPGGGEPNPKPLHSGGNIEHHINDLQERGFRRSTPKPEIQQQGQGGRSREQSSLRPQREYNPIEDALMDWRFNEEYNDLLHALGIFIKGEPTGLPEDRRDNTISDFNRTEGLAFTIAFARALAVVWLEKHPDSQLAKEIAETRVGFSLTGEQLMNFINQVAAEVKPPFRAEG